MPSITERPHAQVSVAIVSHNCREELSACLEKLAESGPGIPLEVFVVDNASSDGTPQMVAEKFPWVRLTTNTENLFFTRANNQALSRANGRYVLILNPDTILEEGTILNMVAFMEAHPDAGAASCVFTDSRGSVIRTCWRYRTLPWLLLSREPVVRVFRNSRVLARAAMTDWDRLSDREVDVVSDAFLFARLQAVQDAGCYDERFLLYLTEDDLCKRMRSAGYKILHNSGARICHLVSRSTRKKPLLSILRIQRDDFAVYFRKHHGAAAGAVAWLACTLELAVWWLHIHARSGGGGGGSA